MSTFSNRIQQTFLRPKLLRADWPDRRILQKITLSLLKGAQEPYQKSSNLPAFTGAFKKMLPKANIYPLQPCTWIK